MCAIDFGDHPIPAPVDGTPLLAGGGCPSGTLPGNTEAWWICDA